MGESVICHWWQTMARAAICSVGNIHYPPVNIYKSANLAQEKITFVRLSIFIHVCVAKSRPSWLSSGATGKQ